VYNTSSRGGNRRPEILYPQRSGITETATVLEATGIKKRFGGIVALANGNLTCTAGRITGLLGANGSGKSTISKIIVGVYSADEGEVKYRGKPVRFRNPDEARREGIAMVYQNLSLVGDLTVWQNIVLGKETRKGFFLNNRESRDNARRILKSLLPALDIERMIFDLSPGEMQIVEIAKAIASDPRLLILDEPTSALEKAQVKSLMTHMRELADSGVAITFTSHRLWEVMEICDDVTVFRNGENVGTVDFGREGKRQDQLVQLITGKSKEKFVKACSVSSCEESLFTVQGLRYGDFLRDISIDLRRGEILGIGGLAGQGQEELLLALAGACRGASCQAVVNNRPVSLTSPRNAIAARILLVPGDREQEGLFSQHSVFNNIAFPKAGLKGEPFFTPRKRRIEECETATRALSIVVHDIDEPVNTLSGGNQQKVVVAKWLSFNADVLLLADPAKGVDVGAKRDLYAYIARQVRERQMGVILYASDNEELIEYCDRVLIMYEGQIVACLEGEEINEDKIIAASMRVV